MFTPIGIYGKRMIKEILSAAVTMFAPILVMMLIDLITGLAKALKINDKISSSKLRSTVTKTIVYFIVLLIGGCLTALGEQSIGVLFAIFIGLVEGVSILENLGEMFPQHKFIKKLKSILKKKQKENGNE